MIIRHLTNQLVICGWWYTARTLIKVNMVMCDGSNFTRSDVSMISHLIAVKVWIISRLTERCDWFNTSHESSRINVEYSVNGITFSFCINLTVKLIKSVVLWVSRQHTGQREKSWTIWDCLDNDGKGVAKIYRHTTRENLYFSVQKKSLLPHFSP